MPNDNLLIVKNSGILFIRLIFTSIIGLFTSRIIIHSLGASDYGLYSVVGGVVVMMAFLNTVMTSTTYRFIAFEIGKGRKEGVNEVFNISFVIHISLSLLVILLTEIVGVYYVNNFLNVEANRVADAVFVLRFSTYATAFSIVSLPYQGLITAKENFAVRATIEVLRSFLGLMVAIVIAYYFGNKLRLFALLMALTNLIPPILFFYYCNRKYADIIKWNFQRGIGKYKEMLGFSGWILIGAAASVGKTSGAALVINTFFGTLINAALGIANQISNMVLVFSRNLAQAAIPQITKSFSSGDTARTLRLAAYVSKDSWFLMLLPALPILLETNFLLNLWLVEVPAYTLLFCQLIIIDGLIGGLSNGLSSVVQATGKIKYFQVILSTTSLLSLPVAYVLFKLGFEPQSILVVFILTTILNTVLWQILLKVVLNFNVYFFIKTSYLKSLYVAILVSPLFFIRDFFQEGFPRFILFSLVALIWLIVAIYFAGMEKKEKEMIKQIVRKLQIKIHLKK